MRHCPQEYRGTWHLNRVSGPVLCLSEWVPDNYTNLLVLKIIEPGVHGGRITLHYMKDERTHRHPDGSVPEALLCRSQLY